MPAPFLVTLYIWLYSSGWTFHRVLALLPFENLDVPGYSHAHNLISQSPDDTCLSPQQPPPCYQMTRSEPSQTAISPAGFLKQTLLSASHPEIKEVESSLPAHTALYPGQVRHTWTNCHEISEHFGGCNFPDLPVHLVAADSWLVARATTRIISVVCLLYVFMGIWGSVLNFLVHYLANGTVTKFDKRCLKKYFIS